MPRWSAEFNQPYVMDSGGKWETSPSMWHWEDLAWRVQDDTGKVLLARARWLRETTGAKNLCIAGGVALNCVANGRIAREAGFESVWIQTRPPAMTELRSAALLTAISRFRSSRADS